MKSFKFVSIILPTYNEAENIIPLIKALHKQVKTKKEIIVVDDNSPDRTSQIVAKFIGSNRDIPVRLQTRKHNRGLTNSIKEGITLMKGDVAVWLDCDFSMPPEVIPQLIRKLDEGYDITKGSRYRSGGNVEHVKGSPDPYIGIFLSKTLNKFTQLLLGTTITDYTTGFVCVKKHVLDTITLRGDYGEYAPDFFVRAAWQGFLISEVPFIAKPRLKGESKTGQNLWQYMKRGRKYLVAIGRLIIMKQQKQN